MKELIELIKQIDISRYDQDEYRESIDMIVHEWKLANLDKILNKAGWLDLGGGG
jgi:hypothetical protein